MLFSFSNSKKILSSSVSISTFRFCPSFRDRTYSLHEEKYRLIDSSLLVLTVNSTTRVS